MANNATSVIRQSTSLERVLFECEQASLVIVTTPNSEYNVMWETLPAGSMRHHDHRFEWTRSIFQAWATGVAERFGYELRFLPIGPEDAAVGAPTQMGVFTSSRQELNCGAEMGASGD